jgi:hypothetical protein
VSKKANPTIIGGFVLGAIAVVVAGVAIFGSGKFFEHRCSVPSPLWWLEWQFLAAASFLNIARARSLFSKETFRDSQSAL